MRSQRGLRGSGTEDGFTLVELIMAIAIIGVITVPLGNIVIGYLRHTDETTARLLESHDVQIASAYWAQDVASIGQRSTQGVLQPSIRPPAMTSESHCTSTGTIATFTWDEFANATDSATVVTVAYRVTYDSEFKQCELHRVRETSPATDVVLVHHLNPASPPTVACAGASPDPTDCTAAPGVPRTVTLNLSVKDPENRDDPYAVVLTGQRRQS